MILPPAKLLARWCLLSRMPVRICRPSSCAFQDNNGNWLLHGVKRFITNGCGEVLLVLARSEPDRTGGLGLSLFVCDRGPTVHIRRLEDKLGIHGSPTCEIFFITPPAS